MPTNTHDELRRLLRERNEHPERLADIDRRIGETFTHTHAVMVLDMSGFSRLTMRYGIIHFLAMIERMQEIVLPIVRAPAGGGRLVKFEADNMFAVFPDTEPAVAAALKIHERLDAANVVLPEDWDLHASIGIGYGDLLMVGDDDMYGNEMNLASKLGEDLGEAGDVLLTEAAFARLPPGRHPTERREQHISGLALAYFSVPRPG